MAPRISDAELIEELQRVADVVGDPPTVREFDEYGDYSELTVRNRFGSWSEALTAADLDGSNAKRPVPKPDLIEELQALAAELGEPPTVEQMNEHGERWASVYQERFGSWNDALTAASLSTAATTSTDTDADPSATQATLEAAADATDDDAAAESSEPSGSAVQIQRDELLADIRRLADDREEGAAEPPTLKEYREAGEYGAQTIYDRFGSWNAAVETAGFEPRNASKRIPEEKLLDEIRRLADGETPPTIVTMRRDGAYWVSTYRNRFGSWTDAVEAAGLEPRRRNLDRETLIAELRELNNRLDHSDPPTVSEMNEHGAYASKTYLRRFDSWAAALEAADIDPETNPQKISEADLIAELRRLADELGKQPSAREMDAKGEFSTSTYQKHFGSWSTAVKRAFETDSPET